MTIVELILYIIPCLIQIFISFIDFKKNIKSSERHFRLVAMLAFIFLTFGMLMIIGAYGRVDPDIKRIVFMLGRYGLGIGASLWIFSQLLWIRNRVTVIDDLKE